MIDVYGALEMYLLEDEELGYVSGGAQVEEIGDFSIEDVPCYYCDFSYGSRKCSEDCNYFWRGR